MKKKKKLKSCIKCKHYNPNERGMLTIPCHIHPFVDKNRNGTCTDYQCKWWKIFWVEEK